MCPANTDLRLRSFDLYHEALSEYSIHLLALNTIAQVCGISGRVSVGRNAGPSPIIMDEASGVRMPKACRTCAKAKVRCEPQSEGPCKRQVSATS